MNQGVSVAGYILTILLGIEAKPKVQEQIIILHLKMALKSLAEWNRFGKSGLFKD